MARGAAEKAGRPARAKEEMPLREEVKILRQRQLDPIDPEARRTMKIPAPTYLLNISTDDGERIVDGSGEVEVRYGREDLGGESRFALETTLAFKLRSFPRVTWQNSRDFLVP